MTQNKINMDLSTLWENPENLFTVRYNDISEQMKQNLVQRIKILAPQYRIRKENGPSLPLIHQVLGEMNPIIFSEADRDNEDGYCYSRFSRYSNQSIDGYNFNILCQLIYRTLCTKKGLGRDDYHRIAHLTNANRTKVRRFLDTFAGRNLGNNQRLIQNEQRLQPIDIGMRELEEARRIAINGGAESLPEGVRDTTAPLTNSCVREAINQIAGITINSQNIAEAQQYYPDRNFYNNNQL